MNSKSQTLTLEIPANISSYKIFIDTCCNFVSDFSHLASDFKRTAKFKLVIMELLTNAMKHCRIISFLEIYYKGNELVIKKRDGGEKFSFKDFETQESYHFPLANFIEPTKIQALLGNNYQLEVVVKSENLIEFLEPPEIDYLSINEIPENFGLMIIKQCSDQFHYYYNPEKEENIFEVVFKF